MTKEDQLKAIREKCIAANPDIKIETPWHGTRYRAIRLADVLLAIPGEMEHVIDDQGHFLELYSPLEDGRMMYEGTGVRWNLRADDLDQQSDATIAFIDSLLCV